MLEDLFGIHSSVKKQTGFIEKCHNGLLYLSQADKMSLECQQRIADYINTGQFTRMAFRTSHQQSNAGNPWGGYAFVRMFGTGLSFIIKHTSSLQHSAVNKASG